jgi:hypothetical protein
LQDLSEVTEKNPVTLVDTVMNERRGTERTDRRKNSRNGRRGTDPRVNWRRLAWLFAAYAVYLSIRSLPSAVRRFLDRSPENV